MPTNQPLRLAVIGAAGRMGTRIIALAGEDERFTVAAAAEAPGHPRLGDSVEGVTIADDLPADCDVMIDFSLPAGTAAWSQRAVDANVPMVIGTTGHDETHLELIRQAATRIAVLKATNMSLGVNIFWRLARQAAALMNDGYDIEITEAHHRFKTDAPSGTALTLLEEVCAGAGLDPKTATTYGRQGDTGPEEGPRHASHEQRGRERRGYAEQPKPEQRPSEVLVPRYLGPRDGSTEEVRRPRVERAAIDEGARGGCTVEIFCRTVGHVLVRVDRRLVGRVQPG